MNKPYWGLCALLLAAFAFFAVLSFWPDGIKVAGLDIKTGTFAQNMKNLLSIADSTASDSVDEQGRQVDGQQPDNWRAPMDTTAKTILFFGDSMLEGLAPRLAAYCDKSGHTLIEVIWYSSSTKCWAESGRLTELINKYHPSYVMVCLGANELYVPDIKTARKPHVKKLLAEIGNLPYLWIGPPNWDQDTGINDLLAENLGKGRFYLSANDTFERSRDGAHPTRASAHRWMDRVIKWMGANAASPIRLNPPVEDVSRAAHIVIYQPPV
jgi:hypothetical protein